MQVRASERADIAARIESLKNEQGSAISPVVFWALIALLVSTATGMVVSAFQSSGVTTYLFTALGFLATRRYRDCRLEDANGKRLTVCALPEIWRQKGEDTLPEPGARGD